MKLVATKKNMKKLSVSVNGSIHYNGHAKKYFSKKDGKEITAHEQIF
jgi:hypothetical protein